MSSESLHRTQAKPTYNGRPRLSLPGFKAHGTREAGERVPTEATPGTEGQPARLPLPLPLVNKPQTAIQSASEPRLSLRPREHASALHFLAIALGVGADALPGVFSGRVPMPLKIGIRGDLLARYPQADTAALGRWLARWTGIEQYLAAVAAGGSRFDLDGVPCGEIAEKDVAYARGRQARKKKKPAAG